MGMYEDDRIRHKNAIFEVVKTTEIACDNCGLELDTDEKIDVDDDPCPRCDERALYVRS